MAREGNGADSVVGDGAVAASLQPIESSVADENVATETNDTGEDDGDESDDDFELETMGDDDEDEDDDQEQGDERAEDDADAIMGHLETDVDELRDELMALAAAAAGDDTIAHRTRTKLSLVDVEMDSLESLLPPDPMENSYVGGEDEYQRFLSSLLPTGDETDNLSFMDEEDEEYRPEEEDDDEDEDERKERRQRGDTTGSEGDATRTGNDDEEYDEEYDEDEYDDQDKQVLRVSKRELTELLWDSTQIKVPPTFPRTTTCDGQASTTILATTKPAAGVTSQVSDAAAKEQGDEAVTANESLEDMKDAAAMKDVNGSVSPQQCIQLASQMHKHFQLLLQTFHMLATNDEKPMAKNDVDGTASDAPTVAKAEVNKDQLEECTTMLRELQIRGKRALEYKAQVLSKVTMSSSSSSGGGSSKAANSKRLGERRVTRSISAAHAAVAHPSMFDIVGSQSMEELTKSFERGCSVADRNQKLQKSMLELDKHILLNRKKRRGSAPRKIVFLAAEDRLLLQGVKRFGVESDAWAEIRETLLPTKEELVLSKRFRYLASKKKRGGANEFKEFHSESHSRRKGTWMIEEDVRLARGVVEYFGDNRRFARISSKYLPHRGRLEIRKRWERLKDHYRSEDGAVKEVDENLSPPRAAAREFATAVKRFLETKLRKKLIEVPAVVMPPVSKKSPTRGAKLRDTTKTVMKEPIKDQVPVEPSNCSVKNLHPALFFSSWAVIHPATLLEQTCEHNWPAFIGEKRKDIASESTLDLVSRAAASRVEEEAATHCADLTSEAEGLKPIVEDEDEDEDNFTSSELEFSLDAVESDDEDDHDGNDDEEESDFEREELLSSDGDESDSEYERMELSDNDDEEEDDDDNGSFDGGELSHGEGDIPPQGVDTQPATVKHTLRLENLRQPGDTRAMRALEALERRITGNKPSVAGPTTGFTPLQLESTDTTFEPLAADEAPFNDADLLAYEELSASSPSSEGDDGFEHDELHSSSDDEVEEEFSEHTTVADRSKRIREAAGAQPLKRPKLHQVSARCEDCGSSSCVCATARMEPLVARIQPRGAGG